LKFIEKGKLRIYIVIRLTKCKVTRKFELTECKSHQVLRI